MNGTVFASITVKSYSPVYIWYDVLHTCIPKLKLTVSVTTKISPFVTCIFFLSWCGAGWGGLDKLQRMSIQILLVFLDGIMKGYLIFLRLGSVGSICVLRQCTSVTAEGARDWYSIQVIYPLYYNYLGQKCFKVISEL